MPVVLDRPAGFPKVKDFLTEHYSKGNARQTVGGHDLTI
jgi:hypothetical protein